MPISISRRSGVGVQALACFPDTLKRELQRQLWALDFNLRPMSQMPKSSGSLAEFLRSSRNRAWLLGLLLVAATLLAYQPAWQAGFI
jgi:hypothetical protein